MYTLRLTRPLLRRFERPDRDDDAESAPTTALGDWYAGPLTIGRQRLIICTSQHSLLSLVVPARDLPGLPERLVVALVGALHALGVPRQAIAAEIDHMTSGRIGPTRSRAVLGVMHGHRRLARAVATDGAADLRAIGMALAHVPARRLAGQRPGDRVVRLLEGSAHA
jgi:hypothetical protein